MLKKMAMQRWAVKMVMPNLRGKTYDSNARAPSRGCRCRRQRKWAKYAAVSHWTKIENLIKKKLIAIRVLRIEAAGAGNYEHGKARQHWAKYAAVSHRTKVKNFIQKNYLILITLVSNKIITQPKHFCLQCRHRKVASSRTYRLNKSICWLFQIAYEGNFDPYLLWPFDKT